MRTSSIASLCVVLAMLIGSVRGQSINIDVDGTGGTPGAGVPASTFAAAGMAGTWNSVSGSSSAVSLVDLGGAATNATLSFIAGSPFGFDSPATTGDDERLLDDILDPGLLAGCTVANLSPGVYTVLTYAWAPDQAAFRTGVSVNGGPVVSVGGTFSGAYVQGVTHAVDVVSVPPGGSITITLTPLGNVGSFNGVQLVKQPPGAPLAMCGVEPTLVPICPCNTPGAQQGHGCPNSIDSGGALLVSSGTASIASDTLVLSANQMTGSATCLFLQGTLQTPPAVFGDGLNCLGGTLTRVGVHTNASGASTYPAGPEPSISVRGGAIAGAELGYQVVYRDTFAFCTSATFNTTNGLFVAWAP